MLTFANGKGQASIDFAGSFDEKGLKKRAAVRTAIALHSAFLGPISPWWPSFLLSPFSEQPALPSLSLSLEALREWNCGTKEGTVKLYGTHRPREERARVRDGRRGGVSRPERRRRRRRNRVPKEATAFFFSPLDTESCLSLDRSSDTYSLVW